jgi:DnaK suppressor protein
LHSEFLGVNVPQTNELQQRLQENRARLLTEIGELREAGKGTTYLEDEVEAFDKSMADEASSLTERQTDMSLQQNLEFELLAIDTALSRITEGIYGTCELCGNTIAPARLNARPASSTCIDCQRSLERQQKISAAVDSGF